MLEEVIDLCMYGEGWHGALHRLDHRQRPMCSRGSARRAALGRRPTARLAHTQWKAPLDLVAQSAATRHFTDDYARFDIRGLEIDDMVFGKVNAFANAQTLSLLHISDPTRLS